MRTQHAHDPQQDSLRWQLLCARQPQAQSTFFYGVITTGIVCKPGCPSRLPKRENVRFFNCCNEALRQGYRPCKRCRPLDNVPQAPSLVARICEWIAEHPDNSSLEAMASAMQYSIAHLQKTFTRITGITPFEYAKALRQQRLYPALATSRTTSEAMEKSGYRSSSQFYEEFRQFSSLPPGSHRQAGRGEVITFAVAETALGAMVVAATSKGLCWISLGEDAETQLEDLQRHFSRAELCPPDADFNDWVSQVIGLVDNPSQSLDLPLDIRGTVFQQQVWEALRHIPVGSTLDYQALAEQLGKRGGARAVAGACAANVLALAVPCHRIIRRDGSLSGYRWGVERKAALLAREKASITR